MGAFKKHIVQELALSLGLGLGLGLGRFFDRVTMCIYLSVCLSVTFLCNFFEASHWPSGHLIRSRPLIGPP